MLQTKTINTPAFAVLANLDLTRELNDAAAIVKTDIQKRYEKNIDLDGSPTKPLKKETIEAKRNYGKRAQQTISDLKATGRKDLVRKASRIKLEASTIAKNAEKPLVATESMWRNQKIEKATRSNQTAKITIGSSSKFGEKNDDEIYGYHHETRPKFGIGEGVDAKIDEMVVRRIEGILAKL